MRTYHGERTGRGCEVTVDGRPLAVRPDLTGPGGHAAADFDWGRDGGRHLSLALLADFFGDDTTARRLHEVFDRAVVAELPHGSWTMTDPEVSAALAPLGWCGCRLHLGPNRPVGSCPSAPPISAA